MAYSRDTDRIVRRLRESLRLIADEHTRQMAALWARAWDDVAPELQAALEDLAGGERPPTRAQLTRSRRLANALALIESRLAEVVDESAAVTIGRLRATIDQAGSTTDQLISSMLPPGTNVAAWSRVDSAQVDAIVQRATEQITKRSYPLADEATATMRRELVRGMLTGTNPRETARRMVSRSESVFNGGLTRAMTISRTESMDAQRAAAQLGEQQNVDVLAGWTWVAALSARTCPACWAMNGTEHPLAEPGPIDHQCGRCVRVPKTKSWKDLGFDIDEPPSILPRADEAFAKLTRSEQIDVLGPTRYTAWRAGQFPLKDWAAKRSTPGWRDSWVPAKPPAGFRAARRAPLEDRQLPWRFGRGSKQLGTVPRATLKAIAQVHDLPLLTDPLRVLPLANAPRTLGGTFTPRGLTLHLNPNGMTKALTTAHEFGHYLDWQMFGGGTAMASATSTAPEWIALRAALISSPEVKALRAIASAPGAPTEVVKHVVYLLREEELFARAYAQWIARKTARRSLLRDLDTIASLGPLAESRQWTDRNFDAIADAFDVLFASRLRP